MVCCGDLRAIGPSFFEDEGVEVTVTSDRCTEMCWDQQDVETAVVQDVLRLMFPAHGDVHWPAGSLDLSACGVPLVKPREQSIRISVVLGLSPK